MTQIYNDLPSPNHNEPPNLRGDILDEIADHLACAMDRERDSGRDDQTARWAVLDKFGNPAEIIRKLWFEAMKERIMRAHSLLLLNLLAVLPLTASTWYLTIAYLHLFNPFDHTMFLSGSGFWIISWPMALATLALWINLIFHAREFLRWNNSKRQLLELTSHESE